MSRRLLAAALSLLLLFSLTTCAGGPPLETVAATGTSAVTTATAVPATTAATTTAAAPLDVRALPERDIAILYTGDVHCAVDGEIGYAGVAALRDALRADGSVVLLADTGDALQGAPIGTFSSGENIVEIMNALGYTAYTPGCRDFDYGAGTLTALSDRAEFAFLSANLTDADGSPVFDAYTLVDAAGVTVAFVGVTSPQTPSLSDGAEGLDFLGSDVTGDGAPLWKAVQSAVDRAREEGADYVVALTHLGTDASAEPFLSTELIAHTTGIDAVLDGYSHEAAECLRVRNADGGLVLLSSPGAALESVGLLYIDREGNLSTGLLHEAPVQDAETAALIGGMTDALDETLGRTVGYLEGGLVIADPETGVRLVRASETNLGDLVADAFRTASGADIAVVPGSSLRAGLSEGTVTLGNLLAVLPDDPALCTLRVTGSQLLDALEYACRACPEESPAFLQVSGITFELDMDVSASDGSDEDAPRVRDVLVGGEPLDPAREYTLCTFGSLLSDPDAGFAMLEGCELLSDGSLSGFDALRDYLSTAYAENAALYESPGGDGRITAVSSAEDAPAEDAADGDAADDTADGDADAAP
ncbi:MAG: bifunctional UDP-sugar hydrolase/5'-nucleotidase [Clostridiaceae bacterium]|nr:bifunctional UDP-sugar hydrolase/5'-nucleotidase [Clostridiaceae bacterium]